MRFHPKQSENKRVEYHNRVASTALHSDVWGVLIPDLSLLLIIIRTVVALTTML